MAWGPGRLRDSAAACAYVDFRLIHGVGQGVGVAGVVGKKVDVYIEGDEKGFIFGAQNAAEKSGSRLLLQGKNVLLAAAGVEQDPQGQGLIVLGSEVLDLLRGLVFQDGEVVLGEVGNQRAVLVMDGEVKADQVDVDLEGGYRLLGRPDLGLRPGPGRGVRGRRNLRQTQVWRPGRRWRTAKSPRKNAEDGDFMEVRR